MFTIQELKDLWNSQADQFNQWDELGLDEIVYFAQEKMRDKCAGIVAKTSIDRIEIGTSDDYALELLTIAEIEIKEIGI